MASFIAKQLIGNQLDSVKGAVGGDKEEEKSEGGKGMDPEMEEALREAEEKRQEKHRKMEAEREVVRQEIRDKYGLKKREDPMAMAGGGLTKPRKSPAELEAEAEAEDSVMNMLPEGMRDTAKNLVEGPSKMVKDAQDKCVLM